MFKYHANFTILEIIGEGLIKIWAVKLANLFFYGSIGPLIFATICPNSQINFTANKAQPPVKDE